MSTINIRTDKTLKSKAIKIFKKMGLDMSGAVKLFLHQVVITESIPFDIKTKNGFSSEQEEALLKENKQLRNDLKSGKAKVYNSATELSKDLLK